MCPVKPVPSNFACTRWGNRAKHTCAANTIRLGATRAHIFPSPIGDVSAQSQGNGNISGESLLKSLQSLTFAEPLLGKRAIMAEISHLV